MKKFHLSHLIAITAAATGQKSFHFLVPVSPEIKASRRTICFMTSHHMFLCRLSNNAWGRIVLAYLALGGSEKGGIVVTQRQAYTMHMHMVIHPIKKLVRPTAVYIKHCQSTQPQTEVIW